MLQTVLLLGLLALMLFIITLPVRLGWKVLCNTLCGFGSLIVLNLLHPITGMLFELNVLTCAIVGTLGLPGVGALVIAHYVLGG